MTKKERVISGSYIISSVETSADKKAGGVLHLSTRVYKAQDTQHESTSLRHLNGRLQGHSSRTGAVESR